MFFQGYQKFNLKLPPVSACLILRFCLKLGTKYFQRMGYNFWHHNFTTNNLQQLSCVQLLQNIHCNNSHETSKSASHSHSHSWKLWTRPPHTLWHHKRKQRPHWGQRKTSHWLTCKQACVSIVCSQGQWHICKGSMTICCMTLDVVVSSIL